MRRFLGVMLGVMFYVSSFGQAPVGFTYQAVLRSIDGQIVVNQNVVLRVSILSNDGLTTHYSENHALTSSMQGIVNLVIGNGTDKVGVLADVPWEKDQMKLKMEMKLGTATTYTLLGTQPLQAVPYALHASSVKEITSNPAATDEEPIFVVRNKEGKIVFAVYQGGVRVYVEDTAVKGAKGGFAVGGLSTQGKAEGVEYLRITSDSARIYIDTSSVKGAKGGFAVGGLSTQGKGDAYELLRITKDSTRIYVSDESLKGAKGGFAVGGLSTQGKNSRYDLMRITKDSTRIYVNQSTKGAKGGFAVGGLSTQGKSSVPQFLNLTPANYFIGHESGKIINTGLYNSTLGYQSGISLYNGLGNSFIGFQSGYSTSNGSGNLFIGYQSGY